MPPKRKRRQTEPGTFSDPLSDYSEPEYADELERALAEDALTDMDITPFEAVPPTMLVGEAVQRMASSSIYSMMIVEDGKLVGIFTERDVLTKVAEQYETVREQPISSVMTPNPVSVYDIEPPAKALNLMTIGGFRHIPVLNADDKVVGIVGPQRTSTYLATRAPAD